MSVRSVGSVFQLLHSAETCQPFPLSCENRALRVRGEHDPAVGGRNQSVQDRPAMLLQRIGDASNTSAVTYGIQQGEAAGSPSSCVQCV